MEDKVTVINDSDEELLHLISEDTTVCGLDYEDNQKEEFDIGNAGIWCADCLTGIRLKKEEE